MNLMHLKLKCSRRVMQRATRSVPGKPHEFDKDPVEPLDAESALATVRTTDVELILDERCGVKTI